jgi:quinoprotein glucose dehydrogenase
MRKQSGTAGVGDSLTVRGVRRLGTIIFMVVLAATATYTAQTKPTDWPAYGNDPGGMRYSPLDQINTQNVRQLRRAWTFHTGDASATQFQGTPLVVGGVMYFAKGKNIFAVEAHTGKQLWRHDTDVNTAPRGLSYWPGDSSTSARVVIGVRTGLLALEASTGKLAAGFGENGYVEMGVSLPSPPAIYRDLAIGGSRGRNDIRAINIRTGKLEWTFHTVPRPGEHGADTWPGDTSNGGRGAYLWGFMSVDADRGLLFAPVKASGGSYYEPTLTGAALYGNSLLAIEAATGKLVWYQQLIHHDIWDYDIAAEPALIDIRRGERTIPAVVQMTKMGLMFIFDRTNGTRVYDVVERPVPQSTVPGERTSPTQPFPVKPIPLARNSFSKEELYNLTPEHAAFCKAAWEKYQMYNGGPYAPYAADERTAVIFPGTLGGGNWWGVSFDPALGYIFTNTMDLGQIGRLQRTEDGAYRRVSGADGMGRFWDPKTLMPCQNPPWGRLSAVNANTGEVVWQVPLGIVEALEARGVPGTGTLNSGGSIATAGGLVFIAATIDARIRAFDSRTGKEVWSDKLEANGYAIPSTFMGRDGKQYLAVPAGGGGNDFQDVSSDALVVYSLP